MGRVQQGETALLDLLVRRYEKPLYSFAFRSVGNAAAAEDAFQETFLKVLRKRDTYKVGALFRPWLYRICLNICRDWHRARARRPERELPAEMPLVDPAPGPEAVSAQAMLAQRIREAIEALPDKHRDVFVLQYYQNLPYAEIGEILDLPVGTVKSRVFHASQKLAQSLRDLR